MVEFERQFGRLEPIPTAGRRMSGLCQRIGLKEGSAEITVPYAPGSQASGVEWAEAANVVWYRRSFDRPDWSAQNVLLNIGACDYTADVYLNGHHVCRHQGGYTPVQCAVGRFLNERTMCWLCARQTRTLAAAQR